MEKISRQRVSVYFYFIENGYRTFFKWLFWVFEINIQFFSFDLLLGWIILMISQYWTTPSFTENAPHWAVVHHFANILLSSSCSLFYIFYINIHKWAWRSSLHCVSSECRCYFWLPVEAHLNLLCSQTL